MGFEADLAKMKADCPTAVCFQVRDALLVSLANHSVDCSFRLAFLNRFQCKPIMSCKSSHANCLLFFSLTSTLAPNQGTAVYT